MIIELIKTTPKTFLPKIMSSRYQMRASRQLGSLLLDCLQLVRCVWLHSYPIEYQTSLLHGRLTDALVPYPAIYPFHTLHFQTSLFIQSTICRMIQKIGEWEKKKHFITTLMPYIQDNVMRYQKFICSYATS